MLGPKNPKKVTRIDPKYFIPAEMSGDPVLEEEKSIVGVIDHSIQSTAVLLAIERNAVFAAEALGTLVFSENENVRLAAARDILDRAGYKPVERKDITSGGETIQRDPISEEELNIILHGFLKRHSIDGEAREVRSSKVNLPQGS